jgi:FkbM family methyltransferase
VDLEQRTNFFARAEGFSPYVGVTTQHGAFFLVRTHDQHVGRSLFAKGGRGEMTVMGRAVRALRHFFGDAAVEGTTFIDVGANIGTSIITALVEHGFADGVALEPEQENYETLQLNLVANELDNAVAALQMAVSDAAGSARLVVDVTESGKHWIASDAADLTRRDRSAVIQVPTISLDDLVEMRAIDPARAGLIWIDAQGHEGHILSGATRLTEVGCPVVFEWDPIALSVGDELDRLREVVATHYTHFIDMRKNPDRSAPLFELRAADELGAFTKQFLGAEATRRFTDVLAVRLSSEQTEGRDLSSVFVKRPWALVQSGARRVSAKFANRVGETP